jgi:hypothetical protein
MHHENQLPFVSAADLGHGGTVEASAQAPVCGPNAVAHIIDDVRSDANSLRRSRPQGRAVSKKTHESWEKWPRSRSSSLSLELLYA